MKERWNQILVGLLVVQLLLCVVVFWPRRAVSGAGEPLLPDLKANEVVGLTITDDEGRTITLRRVQGQWVLPDSDDYPADGSKVTTLLNKLAGLTTRRLIARTGASHRQLDVADNDFRRRIDLEMTQGQQYRVYLGSSPQFDTIHVRVAGQDATYLATGLSAGDAQATAISWVDPVYLRLEASEVQTVTLKNRNGTLRFLKGADGKWTLEGLRPEESADPARISALVQTVTSLRMTQPLGKDARPEYGMESPTALVTIQTSTQTITLTVGAQNPDDKTYVVIASTSPYFVRVTEAVARDLVERGRDYFLQPPTPTATPTATPESASVPAPTETTSTTPTVSAPSSAPSPTPSPGP
ncbi:MAG: DUF4340 domain-containing protein [Chloroflexia bacterium]